MVPWNAFPKGKKQKLLKQARCEAIRGGAECGKLKNTSKAFSFKCLKTNKIVCKINFAAGKWIKICKNWIRKFPVLLEALFFSNQLLSLVLLISLWVFGKFLVPLKFIITVFLDNGIGPKLQKAEPLCFQTLSSALCQTLRNPRPFLSLHPHPPLHLRWIDCRDFSLRVHCLKVCVINVSILPHAPKQNLDVEALL